MTKNIASQTKQWTEKEIDLTLQMNTVSARLAELTTLGNQQTREQAEIDAQFAIIKQNSHQSKLVLRAR